MGGRLNARPLVHFANPTLRLALHRTRSTLTIRGAMRIKFERGNTTAQVKTGLFSARQFMTHDIRLTVDFLEEEKAIIAQSGLADYLFYEQPPDPILTGAGRHDDLWAEAGMR